METRSKVPSAQPFNVRPVYSKRKFVRDGADRSDPRVLDIMRRSREERNLVAGKS